MKLTAKNKKLLGNVAVAIAIAALAYFLFKDDIKRALDKTKPGTKSPDTSPAPGGTQSPGLNLSKILKKGSKGAEVTELQRRLKKDGGAQLLGLTGPGGDGVDGIFGVKTEAALKRVKGVVQIALKDYGNTAIAASSNNTSSNTPPYTEGWLNDR